MKLDYIYLDSYKNLKDFEVAFNEGSSVNALIGNNGSGKSNVLEALATAFAAVYNEQTRLNGGFLFHAEFFYITVARQSV